MKRYPIGNNRGVALLITLLVTALLLALIFEFAYGTRVSLRAAANFRDSQRAYFLAQSGVYVFAKYKELQDNLPQGEWGVVPVISGGDTELRIRWEDEAGKIKITDVKTNKATQTIMKTLFETVKGIDVAVMDRITDSTSDIYKLSLLTCLHQYMSDEDYNKVYNDLTVSPVDKININTASADVLQSLGLSAGTAGLIIETRQKTPYTAVPSTIFGDLTINGLNVSNYLTAAPSNIYKVYSYATVGGYTKQIEAIIYKDSSQVLYWRAL